MFLIVENLMIPKHKSLVTSNQIFFKILTSVIYHDWNFSDLSIVAGDCILLYK